MTLQQCIEKFLEHVNVLEEYDANGNDGFNKDFKKLVVKSRKNITEKTFPVKNGETPFNITKNRYKDILPYDHSRVTLSEIDGKPGSDYMNANYVYGATGYKTYIASQGPLPTTVNDFWRMIWEYDAHVVIMACNEYEGIKLKCQRYWPHKDEKMEFNGIHVQLVEQQDFDEFIVRVIQASVEDDVRLLYQFHYTSWPDHGTPTNMERILDMMAMVRQYQRLDVPPLVVHCSAGCGRTGTILAIDYTWSLLRLGKLDMEFSLYKLIAQFRTQRQSMVQSEDQYIFLHLAVKELFERHLVLLEEHLYENVLNLGGVCGDESVSDDEVYQDVAAPNTSNSTASNIKIKKTVFTLPVGNQAKPNSSTDSNKTTPPSQRPSLSSSSSSTSPKPPPKPNRIFSTSDSPTKAVIMETLQRLMSGSEIEDDSSTPVFQLKTPVPRNKKAPNKNISLKEDNIDLVSGVGAASGKNDVSQKNEAVSASSKTSGYPVGSSKPLITSQKPALPKTSSVSDDSLSLKSSKTDNTVSSPTFPKMQDDSQKDNQIKKCVEDGNNIKTDSEDGVKPLLARKPKQHNYENITEIPTNKTEQKPNYMNVKTDFKAKKESLSHQKGNSIGDVSEKELGNVTLDSITMDTTGDNDASSIRNEKDSSNLTPEKINMDSAIKRRGIISDGKISALDSEDKNTEKSKNADSKCADKTKNIKDKIAVCDKAVPTPSPIPHKHSSVKHKIDRFSAKAVDKNKSDIISKEPEIRSNSFPKSQNVATTQKSPLDRNRNCKSDSDSKNMNSVIKSDISLSKELSEKVVDVKAFSKGKPQHAVSIDFSGNNNQVKISNNSRKSQLGQHNTEVYKEKEQVHNQNQASKPRSWSSHESTRKPSRDYQTIEYDVATDDKGNPFEKESCDYSCVGDIQIPPAPKSPKNSNNSSLSCIPGQQLTNEDTDTVFKKDVELYDSDDEEGYYEVRAPPVPPKSFSGEEEPFYVATDQIADNISTLPPPNRMDQVQNSSSGSHKTINRNVGQMFRDKFQKISIPRLGGGSGSGASGMSGNGVGKPATVIFKNKDISFGKTVSKPKGRRTEGQAHKINQHNSYSY